VAEPVEARTAHFNNFATALLPCSICRRFFWYKLHCLFAPPHTAPELSILENNLRLPLQDSKTEQFYCLLKVQKNKLNPNKSGRIFFFELLVCALLAYPHYATALLGIKLPCSFIHFISLQGAPLRSANPFAPFSLLHFTAKFLFIVKNE